MIPLPFFRRRARRDAELRAEIEAHLAMAVRDRMARGESREEAEHAARRELGNEALIRAVTRDAWGGVWLEHLAQNLRYAIRGLVRSPGLTAAVVITLGLGLGANAAIFSLLDRIFLREPAGVVQPERVVRLYQPSRDERNQPAEYGYFSYPVLQGMRAAVGHLGVLAAYRRSTGVRFGRASEASVSDAPGVTVVYAGPRYFDLLGVRPERGRIFAPEEERMGAGARVAVISDALWRSRLGGDPKVLGQVIQLDGARYVVVGVAPHDFRGTELDGADVWLPLALLPGPQVIVNGNPLPWSSWGHTILHLLARPAEGVTPTQLTAAATAGARAAARGTVWGDTLVTVSTGPLIEGRGPGEKLSAIPIATRLAGVALIVLLIACANVANLLLARGMRRRQEIAVRLALGVGRRRLIAQLATESLLLALVAGGGALLAGIWGGDALRAALVPGTHWAGPVLSGRALTVMLLATLGCGLLTGLAPALQLTRPDLADALKGGPRQGGPRSWLRDALIVAQAALSLVLLVGSGLFVRSLERVEGADIGYDADRLVFADVVWDETRAPTGAALLTALRHDATTLEHAADRLRHVRGIDKVALASGAPMFGGSLTDLYIPGPDSIPTARYGYPGYLAVSPSFFAATGLRLLDGRALTAEDERPGSHVAIINRTMAQALWPGRSPIGRCVHIEDRTSPCTTVVGVVENGRQRNVVEHATMQFYVPLDPSGASLSTLPGVIILRAKGDGSDAAAAALAGDALRGLLLPGARRRVRRMTDLLAPQYRQWRLGADLFTALGLLALIVAAFGIYSALAYAFSQRTHEIGVRMALGARAADILELVLAEGLRLVVIGVLVGAALALAAGRFVASLLYDTSTHDPVVMAAVALVLLATAGGAALIPAWRAARVDPVGALRSE